MMLNQKVCCLIWEIMPIKMALQMHVCDKNQPALYPSKLQCVILLTYSYTHLSHCQAPPPLRFASWKVFSNIRLGHSFYECFQRLFFVCLFLLYQLTLAHISWLVQAGLCWFAAGLVEQYYHAIQQQQHFSCNLQKTQFIASISTWIHV